MSDNSALRTFLEGIRDERRTSANTAFRIGSAFIELLDLLENLDLDDKYLSKVHDDEAHGFIKFLKGLESTTVTFSEYLKSKGASKGFLDGKGIYMDALEGLIQTEGLEVSGFMRIMELIINRLHLMESDYSFTEGCEVEHIDYLQDGRLKLTIHKRHDKDYQPFYYGDILYAKVNILLLDYNRMPFEDKLMPLGQLREPVESVSRCDMVVVTKCPVDLAPMEIRMFKQQLNLLNYQKLFFSTIRYGEPVPVFPVQSQELTSLQWLHEDDAVLCLTGIATPKPLVRYLRQFAAQVKVMHFDDHHFFTRRDFGDIFKVYKSLTGKRKFIITTEKDAVRIMNNPYYPPIKRNCIYYIPMRVGILAVDGPDFVDELVANIDKQEEEANLTTMSDDNR